MPVQEIQTHGSQEDCKAEQLQICNWEVQQSKHQVPSVSMQFRREAVQEHHHSCTLRPATSQKEHDFLWSVREERDHQHHNHQYHEAGQQHQHYQHHHPFLVVLGYLTVSKHVGFSGVPVPSGCSSLLSRRQEDSKKFVVHTLKRE